ncbi:MAG: hypothetical protein GEV12_18615 [Micromonosporaceae bacterium]|nr:hypothetical protein [Micromonosporaceae bacterium]
MYHHPETILLLANETRRTLIAQADRERLLRSVRRSRRPRRAERGPARAGAPAGTLAPCAPTAVPAR